MKLKTIKRILRASIWAVVILYVSVAVLVQLPAVQGWIGERVASVVGGRLGARVSVDRVHLGLLGRVVVDGFRMYDKRSVLMVSASRLAAKVDYALLIRSGRIRVSSAQMFGVKGVFYSAGADVEPNYQFVLDSLASGGDGKSSLELSVNSLIIRHGSVKYDRYDVPPTPSRFNPCHLFVKDISAHMVIPYYTPDSMCVSVKKLSLSESSGIIVKRLGLDLTVRDDGAELEGLELDLPGSEIRLASVHADYVSRSGGPDLSTLRFWGRIGSSKVSLCDLACFVPSFAGYTEPLFLSAEFSGTGRSLDVGRLDVRSSGNGVVLAARGRVAKSDAGAAWYADIDRLACTASGLDMVLNGFTDVDDDVAKVLLRLGDVSYSGNVSGEGRVMALSGLLRTDVGRADVRFRHDGGRVEAYVNSAGLDVGRLLDNGRLGMLATTVKAWCRVGKGGISDVRIDGVFPRFDYNGYSYSGITAKGTYGGSSFNGLLSVDDPNGSISVSGSMDLSASGRTADIDATVRRLDLAALKITDRWSGAKFDLDVSMDTRMSGNEANLFKGRVGVRNFSMYSSDTVYRLDSLDVVADAGSLALHSDFATARITGDYRLRTIARSLTGMLGSRLPTLFGGAGATDNRFTLNAEIVKTDWLSALFDVPLELGAPLKVSANVDDGLGVMSMVCHADRIDYDGNPYENFAIRMDALGDTLSVDGSVCKVMGNGHRLDLSLEAAAVDDKLATSVRWSNNMDRLMAGVLNAETRFVRSDVGGTGVDIAVKPSHILVNDTIWNVLPSSIAYNGGDLTIDHFAIEHDRQHIRIDGMATKHADDSITVDLQDVDVNYVLGLVNFHSVEFGGNMTGKAYVKSVFYEPDAYADLIVDNFTFEHGRMGKLFAKVNWNKEDKRINIDARADDADNARTTIQGYVSPANNRIDLGIKAEDTNIEFLESFCGAFMDEINAKANGNLRLHGPLDAIELTGKVVADGKARITPINVSYILVNDTIHFMPDNIVFRADTIRDRNGNIGIVNGSLHHKHLSHLTYDVSISTKNLLCYDTNGYGDDSFYGTAYGTGVCSIQGRDGRVDIDIDITPENNSFIEYNAASPGVISDQQFITWRDKTSLSHDGDTLGRDIVESPAERYLPVDIPSDMRINFIVNMTPDATLRVLMDKNTNDYIALNGTGTIRASYFNKGSFDMFGTYTIDHGVYTLTIQNIIKKIFQFQRGGTIVFGGDPYDALLDLQAVYTVNGVPLSDLQLGNSFSSNNVRVDCLMNISGTPQAPHVDFNIDMPTVNEDAEQMVRTVINGEEEMNQQVVYLLSVGRFYMQSNNNSSEQNQSNQTSLAMQSLLSGTISQQINTLLGSLVKNNNWTFGANISTGDEGFNNAEYEGLLSGRLLNNRLIINGQFGYRDNANATTSFIGDFDINYLLLPNGNIALKVYNQTNDRYFTKSSLNTQGIGIILKKDFNSLLELFGYKRKSRPSVILPDDADD